MLSLMSPSQFGRFSTTVWSSVFTETVRGTGRRPAADAAPPAPPAGMKAGSGPSRSRSTEAGADAEAGPAAPRDGSVHGVAPPAKLGAGCVRDRGAAGSSQSEPSGGARASARGRAGAGPSQL